MAGYLTRAASGELNKQMGGRKGFVFLLKQGTARHAKLFEQARERDSNYTTLDVWLHFNIFLCVLQYVLALFLES